MANIDSKGILHGGVSNIIYRTYRGEQIAQIKPDRVKQTMDTKEAGLEFGLCSSTAKVVRKAFARTYKAYDGKMINRLSGKVRKAVTGCKHKERGERDIHDAELSHLIGFQFNAASPMEKALSIRPELQFTAENQIKIYLPQIKSSGIKGPAASKYILRLLAISFNFKKDVYSYSSYREVVIDAENPWNGGEILMEGFADGRLVLLSMSLHAYEKDDFGGMDCLNSQSWSPSEIIGAWHANGVLDEPDMKAGIHNGVETMLGKYIGNQSLEKLAKLRGKSPKGREQAARSEQTPSANSVEGFELPEGDVGFDRE